MKKRLLAMVMAFVMAMSLLPMSALAVNVEQIPETSVSTEASSPVQITKQVSGRDGDYTLTMDAYVTGKVTTTAPTPLDIVLVLDVSGSMADDISIVTDYVYKEISRGVVGETSTNLYVFLNFNYGDGTYYYKDGETYSKVVSITREPTKTDPIFGTPLTYKYIYTFENGNSYETDDNASLDQVSNLYTMEAKQTSVSKMQALQDAVNSFIDKTAAKNAQIADTDKMNRISIVKFAGEKTTTVGDQKYEKEGHSYNYSQIVKPLTEVNTKGQAALKSAVNELTAAGATSADYGMELAKTVLSSSSGGRNKVVIFFTDGEPNHVNGFSNSVAATTVNTAKELKDSGTKIYTIGVLKSANPDDTTGNINKYMNAVSSNYPTATATGNRDFNVTLGTRDEKGGYYKAATNADELNEIFGKISNDIMPDVTADATSVLSDTLSSYVKFADDPNVVVKKVPASGMGETPDFNDKDATVISNPNYTISEKTITVTGFDYSANHVYKDKENGWHGSKLVVSFDVVLDDSVAWTVGTNLYPTNDINDNKAGLKYGEGENDKTELTKSPEIEVTAYGVTYHGNGSDGGTPVTDTQGYLPGTTVTVKENTFTKTGHAFTEWNSQADGMGKKYEKSFTMPAEAVNLYAQWKATDLTITFDANGGKWSEAVEGYEMNGGSTKASKNYQPSVTVDKIPSNPVKTGKVFNGWYLKIPGVNEGEYEKYPITVWNSDTPKAQDIATYGGVIYADWVDAPVATLTYTTRQHYIGVDGKEAAVVNVEGQKAPAGTAISSLISSLEKNQTYYAQNYVYVANETTVDGKAYKTDMKLTQSGTVIDLYYYLDEWNDKGDTTSGGDNTPDCQQAVVNFRANPNGTVGKAGEKTTQVFTLEKGENNKYSKPITPETVTPVPSEGFAFDIWTKDADETGVNPFVAQTLNGGDNITYTAHFAADVIGPDGEGDLIPDKYQATVTFKVVNGTWEDDSTNEQKVVVTLCEKGTDGVWIERSEEERTIEVPAGMKPAEGYLGTSGAWNDTQVNNTAKAVVTGDATYTYTFSGKNKYTLTVNYLIEDSTTQLQDSYSMPVSHGESYNVTEQVPAKLIYGEKNDNYVKVSSDALIGSATDNVIINVYYALDNWKDAEETEDETDKDSATGGDGIPDKYQAVVYYKSNNEDYGTVSKAIDVVTMPQKDDGVYAEQTDITGANASTTSLSRVYFNNWTLDKNKEYKNTNLALGSITVKAKEEYTYTANFGRTSGGGGGSSKPPVLNKEDHYAYIVGYPDGTVQPQGNITRAEVATIFFRMLTDDSRNEFWSQTNSYSDVSEGQWFNNAISTLANAGILSGYPDGTFRPNAPITRAEFTKIAASFFERVEYTIDNPFNDVDDDDWFYKFVMAAYEGGLITGYPEGDFRPNANISRAESVTIVNRTLERAPDADHFLKDMIVWPDNAENAWYYEAVQEATNSHEYVVKGTGTNKYEEWTKILEVRDWPALEKEWSNANSATGGEVVK